MTSTDMRFLEHDAAAEAEDRSRARAAARRHTRFVKTLRVLLPLGGMAIVALIFGTAIVKSFLPVEVGMLNVTSEGLEMNDPNLAGRLNDGRAYKVSAAKAMQSFSDTSRITLTDLVATLNASDAQDITVKSRGGLFDTDDEWLTLSDGVVLTTTDGYRAELSSARLDFRNGSMVSEEPISISSNDFDLASKSIEVQEEGKVVRFVGDVHLTLHRGMGTSSQ